MKMKESNLIMPSEINLINDWYQKTEEKSRILLSRFTKATDEGFVFEDDKAKGIIKEIANLFNGNIHTQYHFFMMGTEERDAFIKLRSALSYLDFLTKLIEESECYQSLISFEESKTLKEMFNVKEKPSRTKVL
jgi:hypothetical protein